MMKTLLATVALTLVAGTALAGEGNGNPFPFAAAPLSVSMQGYKQAPNAMQNPYPFSAPGIRVNEDRVLPPVGSEGDVQTANSLPAGFMAGPEGSSNANQQAAPAMVAGATTVNAPHG